MPIAAYPGNFVRFLGTAGTRFIMLSQRRSSGGIWFSYGGARGVIDPGPGSLVRMLEANPRLSPIDINTLILTHRHIDHSSDVNALAEGMVLKSQEPRGFVLSTHDALEDGDRVIMRYLTGKIAKMAVHEDSAVFSPSGGVTVESVKHEHHGVECFGVVFRAKGLPSWGIISDTAPLPDFPARYGDCDFLIINTTLLYPKAKLDHLSIADVKSLLQLISPKTAVITHMSNELLDKGGDYISDHLSNRVTRVIAATDGMTVNLEEPFKTIG